MDIIIFSFFRLLNLLVFAHVILSYFMPPFHPLREAINRIVEPMLAPIRQMISPVGGLDFSPLVLIVILQLLSSLLINLF